MGYARFNKGAFGRDIPEAAAFTLIELLIALSIFSTIAISIYTAFNAGIFSWRRLNIVSDNYQQSAAALDLMADDIASYIPGGAVKFEGAKDKITFLSRVKNDDKYELAKVSFFFDAQANSIMLTQESVNSVFEIDQSKKKAVTEELSGVVKGLEFKYFCKKAETGKEYEWVDSFNQAEKSECSAVSISIATIGVLKRVVLLNVEADSASQI